MSRYDAPNPYQPGGAHQTPPMPGGPPQKKSKTLVWVLAGCGGLALIAVLVVAIGVLFVWKKAKEVQDQPVLAAAKLMIAANPDVELVSVDEQRSVITIREKKTGKTITVNFEDIAEGRIDFTGEDEGTVTFEAGAGDDETGSFEVRTQEGTAKFGSGSEEPPDWVPSYPGATISGNFSVRMEQGESGSFRFVTTDSIERVLGYYESELRQGGMKVQTSQVRRDGKVTGGIASAEDSGRRRTVFVNAVETDEGVTVSVTFAVKK